MISIHLFWAKGEGADIAPTGRRVCASLDVARSDEQASDRVVLFSLPRSRRCSATRHERVVGAKSWMRTVTLFILRHISWPTAIGPKGRDVRVVINASNNLCKQPRWNRCSRPLTFTLVYSFLRISMPRESRSTVLPPNVFMTVGVKRFEIPKELLIVIRAGLLLITNVP